MSNQYFLALQKGVKVTPVTIDFEKLTKKNLWEYVMKMKKSLDAETKKEKP